MFGVARGLGGADGQFAAVTGAPGAHRVMAPAQGERGHAGPPGHEPAGHLQHQAARTEQHGGRVLDPRHQLEPGAEGLRQLCPGIGLRPQPVGLVEGREQLGVEAPAQAAARQGAHLAQGPTAEPGERRLVGCNGCEGFDRQRVEQLGERLRETVRQPGPRHRERGEAGRRPAQLPDAEVGAFLAHALDQAALAAEQAHALFDFHHDRRTLQKRFEDRDAGRELQAPRREAVERLSARLRVGRQAVGKKGCPQHGKAPGIGAPRSGGSGGEDAASGWPPGHRAPRGASVPPRAAAPCA